MVKKVLIFLSLFLTYNLELRAQQDTIKIEPVQVSSFKIIKPKVKIPSIIQKNFWSELSSNIFFRDNSGIMSYVSMYGMKSSHTKILLWSIPFTSSLTGGTDLFLLPLDLFDNIEIGESFASVQKVNGSLGGSLDFNINFRKENGFFSSGEITSAGGYKHIIKGYNRFENARLLYGVYIDFSDNHYKYINAYTKDKFQYMANAQYGKNAFVFGISDNINKNLSVSFRSLNFRGLRNFPPPLSYQGTRRNEYERSWYFIDKFAIDFKNLSIFLAYQQHFSDYNLFVNEEKFFPIVKNNWFSSSTYSKFIYRNVYFSLSGIWNLQNIYFYQFYPDTMNLALSRIDKALVLSVPGIKLNKFVLSMVHRLEAVENKYYYTFNLGVRHRGRINFYLDIGKNVNLPSMSDLYWQPGGNPFLKPEKAFLIKSKFYKHWHLTYFIPETTVSFELRREWVNDWILWKPSQYHYWMAQNIGDVDNVVFNLNWDIVFKTNFLQKLNFKFSYTDVRDSLGYQVIYVPKTKLIGDFIFSLYDFVCNFNLIYESKRLVLMDNTNFYLKSYFLSNFSIKKEIEFDRFNINAIFSVNNILNTYYQLVVDRPQPLRYFTLALQLNIK